MAFRIGWSSTSKFASLLKIENDIWNHSFTADQMAGVSYAPQKRSSNLQNKREDKKSFHKAKPYSRQTKFTFDTSPSYTFHHRPKLKLYNFTILQFYNSTIHGPYTVHSTALTGNFLTTTTSSKTKGAVTYNHRSNREARETDGSNTTNL